MRSDGLTISTVIISFPPLMHYLRPVRGCGMNRKQCIPNQRPPPDKTATEKPMPTPAPLAPLDLQCPQPICSAAHLLRIPHPRFAVKAPQIYPSHAVAQKS